MLADPNISGKGGGNGGYTEGARATRSTNQSIPNNVLTPISFDAEVWDTDSIWEIANPTRLTCKTVGVYAMWGGMIYSFHGTGYRDWDIRLNSVTYISAYRDKSLGALKNHYSSVSGIYKLAVNDYIELMAFQDSGAALNVLVGSAYSPEFAMQRIG